MTGCPGSGACLSSGHMLGRVTPSRVDHSRPFRYLGGRNGLQPLLYLWMAQMCFMASLATSTYPVGRTGAASSVAAPTETADQQRRRNTCTWLPWQGGSVNINQRLVTLFYLTEKTYHLTNFFE